MTLVRKTQRWERAAPFPPRDALGVPGVAAARRFEQLARIPVPQHAPHTEVGQQLESAADDGLRNDRFRL